MSYFGSGRCSVVVPDDVLLWNCLLARGSLTMSYFGSGRCYAA